MTYQTAPNSVDNPWIAFKVI